jgi:hypothetical protein
MCDTCNNITCTGCTSSLTGGITFDGTNFVCTVDGNTQFEINSGENLNAVLSTLFSQTCSIFTGIDSGILDGSEWFVGSGVPNDANNSDGDLYLNSDNGDVYKKDSGSWGSPVANIKGADGADGTNGGVGNDGADGISFRSGVGVHLVALGNDGDCYVDLSSPNLDLYKKSGGAWADTGLDLKGSDGAAGSNGTNGNDGNDGTSLIQGLGAPGGATGNNGDSYIDSGTGNLYLKSAGTWNLTGNVYDGSIAGQEHLFNAQKTIEQIAAGASANVQLEFSDDSSTGRFDYGNSWTTDIWVSAGNLTDVAFATIINMEVDGVNAGFDNDVTVTVLKNGISIGSGVIPVPQGTPDGTIINFSLQIGVQNYIASDNVKIEISTPASINYATFEGKVLTDSIFYNVQL